jgi:hypothetical protein
MDVKYSYEYTKEPQTSIKLFRSIGNMSKVWTDKCYTKFNKWAKRYTHIRSTYVFPRKPLRRMFYTTMCKVFGVQVYLFNILSARWADLERCVLIDSRLIVSESQKDTIINSPYHIEVK